MKHLKLYKAINLIFIQFKKKQMFTYVNRKTMQFYKGYFINFYQMKALEIK